MNGDDLMKAADIQHIADTGAKIYAQIKSDLDPKERGRFVAIDVDTQQTYLGDSSAEALTLARTAHPNKIFYVIKVGFDVAETMARSYIAES